MKLLERIHAARDEDDLDRLEIEIILDMANFKENQAAYIQKRKELIGD